MTDLTFAERRLIKDTEKKLGGTLCEFLLAGFGQDDIAQVRSFSVLSNNKLGKQEKLLRIHTFDPLGLPNKKEPMVLLALLRTLKLRDDLAGINLALPFPAPEVVEILEWETSEENYKIAQEAIRKYFHLCYVSVTNLSNSFAEGSSFTGNVFRLFTSYMFSTETELGDLSENIAIMNVDLNPEMVEGLMNRVFLGVNWDSVICVKAF